MSCAGHPALKTPHLDRLGEQGMRFTDAHSAAAVCTPTRYTLLTGRAAFLAAMGLTLEQANLDFARQFARGFAQDLAMFGIVVRDFVLVWRGIQQTGFF